MRSNHRTALILIIVMAAGIFAQGQSVGELALSKHGVYKTRKLRRSIPINAIEESRDVFQEVQSRRVSPRIAPYVVVDRATATTSGPEAEEHIAADPTKATTLVAAISDFSLNDGFNTTKYAFSFNNGVPGSWVENFVPLMSGTLITADGLLWEANSDPVVGMDLRGNVYLASLYFNGSDKAGGLYVGAANLHAMGANFHFEQKQIRPVVVDADPASVGAEDKPWLAVDNSKSAHSGNVYITWTHFAGDSPTAIYFSRSTDRGTSWSAPLQISPNSQTGSIQGSYVAVGSAGEIYIAYEVFYVRGFCRHFLAKSTNGGITFTAPAPITPYFNELTFSSTYRKDSFPRIASSPVNPGTVYDIYADQPNDHVGSQIEFIASFDGGASFSKPVVVNDVSTGEQFMPAIAADDSGVIHASWFDTRNNAQNSLYDIYAARSERGQTFSANTRVTVSSLDAGTSDFLGDYAGIAAKGGFAHPVWSGNGITNSFLQTATLK